MDKLKLSNSKIWELYKIALEFGYWSDEVKLFNILVNEPEKTEINNVVLSMIKEDKKLKL